MKKFFAIALCLLMTLTMAFTAVAETATEPAAPMTETAAGGWSTTGEENEAAFNALTKATENLLGMTYEPVYCVGCQVVSGTNYAVVCKCTTVTAEPVVSYQLVYVYEDLNGECSVLQNDVLIGDEGLCGGFTPADDFGTDDDMVAMVCDATAELMGAEYMPVALLGTQLVNGTNYMMLCRTTTVTAEPASHFTLVTVYQDLNGTATLQDVADLQPAL